MKKLFLITVTALACQFAKAQETESLKKNHFLWNVGTQFTDFDALEKNKNLNLGAEYKFKNDLSIGLKYTYSDLSFQHKGTGTLGAPKLNSFQLQFNNDWSDKIGLNTEKFDVYTGVTVGLNFFSYKSITPVTGTNYSARTNTEYITGGQIGFRYYFTKNLAIHTELNLNNYNNSIGTGLTLKL